MSIPSDRHRLLFLIVLLAVLSVLISPFTVRIDNAGNGFALIHQASAADVQQCEQPVSRFRGGPGRRPGSLAVLLSIRQQIQDDLGRFQYASSDETVVQRTGNTAVFRVLVSNRTIYDTGNVVFTHFLTAPSDGARIDHVEVVRGAVYDPSTKQFLIAKILKGETATVDIRVYFDRPIGLDLYQHKVILQDYAVLESELRFPVRTSGDISADRNRTTLEKLGIGGTDVVCFSSDITALSRTRTVESTSEKLPVPVEFVYPEDILYYQYSGDEGHDPDAPQHAWAYETDGSFSVKVSKTVSSGEVRPGMALRFTVTATNDGSLPLTDVILDDRFSQDHLTVEDAGEGEVLPSGMQWYIARLEPGESKVMEYTARVSDGVSSGEQITGTVRAITQDLLGSPTDSRSDTSRVVVIAPLPQAGSSASLHRLLEFFCASVIAGGLYFFTAKRIVQGISKN